MLLVESSSRSLEEPKLTTDHGAAVIPIERQNTLISFQLIRIRAHHANWQSFRLDVNSTALVVLTSR